MKTIPIILGAVLLVSVSHVEGRGSRPQAVAQDLSGVYRTISPGTTLPGGLKNTGSPEDIALRPEAAEALKSMDLTQDPEKLCQPLGPFRMMARDATTFELVAPPSSGIMMMLFENVSHGHFRTIFLGRPRPADQELTWQGSSEGRWEDSALVIESTGFNERTWLNSRGAQHSDALRLTERIRPILAGKYLEYRVTADDPKTLTKPYTYVRYYEKLGIEIAEDVCEE